jgi:hypothetical protein
MWTHGTDQTGQPTDRRTQGVFGTMNIRTYSSWRELRVADCRRAIDQVNERMMAVVEQNGAQIDHLFRI